jgi:hypothetical protein|tara:strand:+ start:30 stop:233 length:204 start_codon:yes stop_codon:yes gene_type:complete
MCHQIVHARHENALTDDSVKLALGPRFTVELGGPRLERPLPVVTRDNANCKHATSSVSGEENLPEEG